MRLANEEIHKYMPSIKHVTIELKLGEENHGKEEK